ncbi:YtxH domain-containing protein [Radiobacillus kanasensis]|uniref:YtxH domain-containing protein n=1 Tax=Radiobacillus kanasensis TaxID=2844358 RepID=UPI001E4A9CC2|nr:YtxH domain-containing protein [Radiobacillus kanasensis]UFU00010.1 YtxH domain-containing protein [Radiobacillus kanasensis]
MGQNKMLKGILIGAVVGGAISLLDRTTRKEVMKHGKALMDYSVYYKNHPSEALQDVQDFYSGVLQKASTFTDNSVDMLKDVEDFLEKVNHISNRSSNS